jgi:hypothetical protein
MTISLRLEVRAEVQPAQGPILQGLGVSRNGRARVPDLHSLSRLSAYQPRAHPYLARTDILYLERREGAAPAGCGRNAEEARPC